MLNRGTYVSELQLAEYMKVYISGSDNPDLRKYGLELLEAEKLDRLLWFILHLMDLGKMKDGHVLDVGCGFGWHAMIIAVAGNCRVVANDVRETMTGPLRVRMQALSRHGLNAQVEALTGDICDIELPEGAFDAVYSNESIEHIHDLDAMFSKCNWALRKGGRFVIANDSNAINSRLIAKTRDMWERRDASWEYIQELKRERPIENRNIEPYRQMREKMVRRANTNLPDEQVQRIVDATAGLVEEDIVAIAGEYSPEVVLPERPPLSWCRNPIDGEYCERLLDPFEIAEIMRRHGFRARVCHSFRKFPLRLLNNVRIKPLNVLLFNIREVFVIVGEKV